MSVAVGAPSSVPRSSVSGREQFENALVDAARAVGRDRLDADMVGAGVPMLLDTGADRRLVAPREHRVDETAGAAACEIAVAKAHAPPVVDVIVEPQVMRDRLSRTGAR